jgi:hypothetical protein
MNPKASVVSRRSPARTTLQLFSDFSLFSQGAILSPELVQLLALIRRQAVAAYARVAIGLGDPVSDS